MTSQHENAEFRWQSLAPGLGWANFTGTLASAGTRWTFPSKGSIWLWLNHTGSGLVWGESDRFVLKPGMYALTGGGEPADWICLRYPGTHHLEVVTIDPAWLKNRLGEGLFHPDLKTWLADDCPIAFCGLMGNWENELFEALSEIPEGAGAEKFIAESKLLQWAAIRLFNAASPGHAPTFCANLRERNPVQRALAYLGTHLDRPLDLGALSKHVGIAPHYLSRKVRAETGATLQRHLRRIRIDRACEQLSSGTSNITETAYDVGYQSLSHFAKAFREETGKSPRQWLETARKTG